MAKFSDEAFQAALAPRQVIRRFPFPGAPNTEIGFRLLSDEESDNARLTAVDYCTTKRKADLLADPEFLDRAIIRESLARACYDVEAEGDAFFASGDAVAKLDNQTIRALWEMYNLHAVQLDPYAHVPLEEVEELGKSVTASENGAALLSLLDATTLRRCVLSMACRLRELSPTLSSPTG